MKKPVYLVDTTLREGEQTPGVSFTIEQKLDIARKLDELGVDMIEAGHPAVAPDVEKAVRLIVKEGLQAEIIGHSRATKYDIEKAAECEVDRIAIFYGVSDLHLRYKHKVSREEALQIIAEHVEFARSHGVKVRFTAEDASRTELDYLIQVVKTAHEAGADRVSLADTVGILTPFRARDLFSKVKQAVPTVELDIHAHNDLGMAVANCLAAFEGGATGIHVTVNGLGERCGIASLQEVAVSLKVLYNIDTVDLKRIVEISKLVERYSGIVLPPHAPVVGDNAFTHKAGVHVAGVLSNPETYEPYPPELVGRTRDWVIDKYTGRKAVKARLERLGVYLTDEELDLVVMKIKERSEVRHWRDEDLLELVEEVTGRRVVLRPPEKIEALVWIKCESTIYTTSVARRVSAIPGVKEVMEITGEYDIVARVSARDQIQLNNIVETIRELRGVKETFTQIVLKKLETRTS